MTMNLPLLIGLILCIFTIDARGQGVEPEVRQAMMLKNAGHAVKAEAILRTVLHQHPNSIPALDELGLVLQAQGRSEEALLQFKKIVKLHPTDAGVYSNMGICLEGMSRDDEALAAFKKAIQLQPNLRSAHVDIANFYRYHHHKAKAVRHLKRAIEITPTDPIAHGGLGAVLSDMKRWDEAETQYLELLKIAPKNVHGITELANVRLRKGLIDMAIDGFRKALEMSGGKWVRALDGLGRAYREKGDLKQAEKYADMAVRLRPVDVQSRDVLASVYMAEGHSKRAASEYATALRYDPKDEKAKAKLPSLVIADEESGNEEVPLKPEHFPGIDLTPPKPPPQKDVIAQEAWSGSSDGQSTKEIMMGLLFVGAVAALAAYLRCCSMSSNESIGGYAPIASENDFSDDFPDTSESGKESLYNL